MEYSDLAIRISSKAGDHYPVTVSSEHGSDESRLELPFALEELAGVVEGVARTIRRLDVSGSSDRPTPRDFGSRLYAALFRDGVQRIFDRGLGALDRERGEGIRIRLCMDLDGPGIPEVASLPWELMAASASDTPLAVSTRSVLVRSLDTIERTDPIPFEPPLRILVVMSNPKGSTPLELDDERGQIEENWASLPDVSVAFAPPTYRDIADKLAEESYHVVHYMGHGTFAAGEGHLALEDGGRSLDLVDSERMRVLLGDQQRLRLVFLNACLSGATARYTGLDPFAGVATGLMRAGIPAVVGMQFPISDPAAIAFADTFYKRVATGRFPIDAAVAEARKILFGGDHDEWATPVLFMRSGDGVLFTSPERRGATARSEGASEAAASEGEEVVDSREDGDEAPEEGAFRVFLAAPGGGLQSLRHRLTTGLKEAGVECLDDLPPPFDAKPHAGRMRELARAADLCVHLLGSDPGEPLGEAGGAATYPLEQLRIGLESARSQLVLMPEEVEVEAVADAEYAKVLASLRDRPRDGERFELARLGPHQMVDEVLARKDRLKRARLRAAAATARIESAYVDVHPKDFEHVKDLVRYLDERDITPRLGLSDDEAEAESPVGASSLQDEIERVARKLADVPLFIVVFGDVRRSWVRGRLQVAANAVTGLDLTTLVGVYVAPPEKDPSLLRFPPLYPVAACMTGFEAEAIEALIERATDPVAA